MANSELDDFFNTVGSNDIFSQIAPAIGSVKFDDRTWSPGTKLGVNAGQAFLSSILGGLGQRNQAQQFEKVAQVLPDLYGSPGTISVPEGVDPEAFGHLKLNVMRQKRLMDLERDDKENDYKSRLFGEVFTKNPKIAVQAFPGTAKRLGLDASFLDKKEESALPALTPVDNPLASGRASTKERIQQYYREFVDQGMPPTQAATSARQQVEGEIKANTKTFDEGKSAREYGQKLLDLASTAKAGLSQAGATGDFEGGREAYDYIASMFDPNAEKRRAGRQVLSSIAPEVIKMNRSPGSVSDYESKLLLGAAPGTDKTPETNALLTERLEDLGKLNLDYADFLDAYREANSGSTVGAQKKWAEYRKAFPLFKGEGDAMQLNGDRPAWQDFFSGSAKDETTGAESERLSFIKQAKAQGLSKEAAKKKWEALQGK